jgi:hypothetical protein
MICVKLSDDHCTVAYLEGMETFVYCLYCSHLIPSQSGTGEAVFAQKQCQRAIL